MAKAPTPVCLDCGLSKVDNPDKFYIRPRSLKNGKDCISPRCKVCTAARMRRWYRNETRKCTIDGCVRRGVVYCSMHRNRIAKYGTPMEAEPRCAPRGSGFIDKNGYRRRKPRRPGGSRLEHVQVMEAHLHRNLFEDERVHHKNGNRSDNRLVNLELWSTFQPPGQRVEDKLEWAREIIARYGAMDRQVA